MSGMESDQNLKGVITDIIFENADSGFKICELETKDDIIIVKGTLPFVQIGETLSLEGIWRAVLCVFFCKRSSTGPRRPGSIFGIRAD